MWLRKILVSCPTRNNREIWHSDVLKKISAMIAAIIIIFILWCETLLGWIRWLIGRRGSTSFTFQFMLESSVSSSPTTSYFSRKNGKRQKWQNNIFRHWSCTKSFTIPRDQILVTYLGFKVIWRLYEGYMKDNWKKRHLFLMPFHPISDVRIAKICSKWDNALEMWGNFSSATFRVCPLSSSFH